MRSELKPDRLVDWLDRVMDSPTLECISWIIIGLAGVYFAPFVARIFLG